MMNCTIPYVLVIVGFLCSGFLSASTLKKQVESSKYSPDFAAALSPVGAEVLDGLFAESQRLGRMPSLAEFEEYMAGPGVEVSREDYDGIYNAFQWAQSPEPTKVEMYKLIDSYRDSIPKSLWIKYTWSMFPYSDQPSATRSVGDKVSNETASVRPITRDSQCFFGMDGDQLYYSITSGKDTQILAYDGSLVNSLSVRDGEPHESSGAIQGIEYRETFVRSSNPLRTAMLLDTARDLGIERESEELRQVVASMPIWETKEEMGGLECVVVGTPKRKYFLSPSHGFAVVAFRYASYEFDPELGRGVKKAATATKDFRDFISISDGVFLPKIAEHRVYQNGKLALSNTTTIDELSTTKPLVYQYEGIEESSDPFQVIPKGTFVSDVPRGATYFKGIDASMEADLRASPPARSRQLFVLANLIAVLILGFVVFRRFAKR